MQRINDIRDGALYRLRKPLGLGTDCITGPGLLTGEALKETIRRSNVKMKDVDAIMIYTKDGKYVTPQTKK